VDRRECHHLCFAAASNGLPPGGPAARRCDAAHDVRPRNRRDRGGAYPSGHATFKDHTDAKGNDAYNQRLSERRTESVRRWLTEKERIEASKLGARGWGAHRPIATTDIDEGRQRNRRVEVVIRTGM
jgi:hypothetical protein